MLAIFPALRSKLNRYVGTMSGGERKMTAIARALMLSPRVLVLDEPTAGLSAVLTESVLTGQVRALADRGHAVLLVEQKAQAALRLAHTASVLVRGQVVMSAPAAEVLASREVAEVFLGGRGRRQAKQSRIGAEVLADVLARAGVDTIFGLPGSTEAALLETLRERPRMRSCWACTRGRWCRWPTGTPGSPARRAWWACTPAWGR